MIIQFCGLSGSGKTTLATQAQALLSARGIRTEVIDGDVYRKQLCPDLGFSKADRNENIRRLAFVASTLARHGVIPIICAINPYEAIRQEITNRYDDVKTIYISCSLETLIARDTKNLYQRALLPEGHPNKVSNLTGVNDPFEIPQQPDLVIHTDKEDVEVSVRRVVAFVAG